MDDTLRKANIAMEIVGKFPGRYHRNGGRSIALLVSRNIPEGYLPTVGVASVCMREMSPPNLLGTLLHRW